MWLSNARTFSSAVPRSRLSAANRVRGSFVSTTDT
jgi:hypothetical protein